MVLGVPDAFVAGLLSELGELDTAGKAVGNGLPFADRGEIENRNGNRWLERTFFPSNMRHRRRLFHTFQHTALGTFSAFDVSM